jgi:hypothetical protein
MHVSAFEHAPGAKRLSSAVGRLAKTTSRSTLSTQRGPESVGAFPAQRGTVRPEQLASERASLPVFGTDEPPVGASLGARPRTATSIPLNGGEGTCPAVNLRHSALCARLCGQDRGQDQVHHDQEGCRVSEKTSRHSGPVLKVGMLWLIMCLHSVQLAVAVTLKDRDALVNKLDSSDCLDNNPTDCTVNQWDVSKVTSLTECKFAMF